MDEAIYALIMSAMLLTGIPLIIHSFRRVERNERKDIRDQYSELVKEKLDIIRTALAMGRDGEEIADLDKRLENLIGSKQMLKTLAKGEPDSEAEKLLKDVDLVGEVDRQSSNSVREGD